ncbi:hypothetical protein GCM10009662_05950 [Catellatospora coxensis]|uniref:Uncharacterized protein n=1 Tax=Catellatospora coxensis TaxID=310354 RepID=A0A8J3KQT9_9ACTN|nr:hypothetical protein Cco03nite_21950 [Catellatospora coxensis]
MKGIGLTGSLRVGQIKVSDLGPSAGTRTRAVWMTPPSHRLEAADGLAFILVRHVLGRRRVAR